MKLFVLPLPRVTTPWEKTPAVKVDGETVRVIPSTDSVLLGFDTPDPLFLQVRVSYPETGRPRIKRADNFFLQSYSRIREYDDAWARVVRAWETRKEVPGQWDFLIREDPRTGRRLVAEKGEHPLWVALFDATNLYDHEEEVVVLNHASTLWPKGVEKLGPQKGDRRIYDGWVRRTRATLQADLEGRGLVLPQDELRLATAQLLEAREPEVRLHVNTRQPTASFLGDIDLQWNASSNTLSGSGELDINLSGKKFQRLHAALVQ